MVLAIGSPLMAQPFLHPGGLHTLADLNRMKTNVLAGNHPWIDDWNILITDSKAQTNVGTHVTANMGSSRQNADLDAHAAYLNFIRWYISGDANYANKTTNILNSWAAAVNVVASGTDTPGLIGIPIAHFAEDAELLRTYSGWKASDFQAFTNMMLTYLYPSCNNFLTNHNGACISSYFANWDACNIESLIAMGVLCDNTNIYNQGVNYFISGAGNGSISNAAPYLYSGGIAQWQESGRDQEHAQLGVGELAAACQTAWNQGLDLFGYSNNRLLAGAEYVAQYNLQHDVPYTDLNDCADDNMFFVANNGRGRLDDRPIWEMIYNHYVVLQGISAPNTTAMERLYRPEQGSIDHFGYGTLTFTLNATNSPYPPAPLPVTPTGLVATPGISQVTLNWTRAAGDLAQGYNVQRSTTSGGPYTTIATWAANASPNTSPNYTDTSVVNGATYYYVVSANNQSGTSDNSSEASVTPTASGPVPAVWTSQDVGVVTNAGSSVYASASDNTFIVTGYGTGIGGTADGGFHYNYLNVTNNFTIIARLTANNADQMGLMVRSSLATNAALVQIMMAANARESTYGVRTPGGNLNHYTSGDQFTALPTWYKLTGSGNTFTAYQSADGVNWVSVQSSTFTMGSPYYAGIAINNGSAVFDNVAYTNSAVTGSFAPPAAPVNLTTTAVASNQVNLTWSAVTNAFSYNVKRANVSSGPYTNLVTAMPASNFYDTMAAANKTYYYVVSSISGGGESTNSIPSSVTTPGASAPVPPIGLTADPSPIQVELNWSASIGASSYNVKRSTTFGGPYTNIATGVIATFTDTNVTIGMTYFYVVSAVNSVGEGLNSTEVSAWVGSTMQTYLKFDETNGTTAFDSTGNGWNGTLVNGPTFVTGYSNNVVNLSSNSSQYITLPSGLVNGLTNFSITAWVKQTTVSTWARIFDFGTGTTVYMMLTPKNGANNYLRFAITIGSNTGEQQINTTTTIPTGVWVQVAVTLNGSVGILYTNGVAVGTNSSMTLNPSSLGMATQNYIGKSQWSDPYYNGLVDEFRIYNGALTASEVATFITPLSAPTNLTATASNSLVTLKWNAAARATSYNVMRSLTNGGPYVSLAGVMSTNYTDAGLANNGMTYYYIVTAINAVGQSTNSSPAAATLVSWIPPQLTFSLNGSELRFNWPADHLGWKLQTQTNSLTTGLGTNWVTVPNSNSTNQISITLNQNTGGVFFRLIYP